jgi:hypothetical protein
MLQSKETSGNRGRSPKRGRTLPDRKIMIMADHINCSCRQPGTTMEPDRDMDGRKPKENRPSAKASAIGPTLWRSSTGRNPDVSNVFLSSLPLCRQIAIPSAWECLKLNVEPSPTSGDFKNQNLQIGFVLANYSCIYTAHTAVYFWSVLNRLKGAVSALRVSSSCPTQR